MRRWIEEQAGGPVTDAQFRDLLEHQRRITTGAFERDPELDALLKSLAPIVREEILKDFGPDCSIVTAASYDTSTSRPRRSR
jgi:hypothetical protein